tara:strand:+ start:465 stop:851 length:387 start_codon:yes stop_codon:yes gene_type:complete
MGCNCGSGKNKKIDENSNDDLYRDMIANNSRVPYKAGLNKSILQKTEEEQQALIKKAKSKLQENPSRQDIRYRWKMDALEKGAIHDYQNMVDKELKEQEDALRARVLTIGGPEEERDLKEFLERKKNL